MSEERISLEELVTFMDGDPTEEMYRSDPAPDPEPDPTLDPEPTPDPEPDPTPDPDPGIDLEPAPTPDPDPEPTPTPDPGDDPEPSTNVNYNQLYELLQDMSIVQVGDDFEFDGTPESLQKALETTGSNIKEKAYSDIWNSISEEFKPVVRYALEGGSSFEDYVKAVTPRDLGNYNLEAKEDQREVIKL